MLATDYRTAGGRIHFHERGSLADGDHFGYFAHLQLQGDALSRTDSNRKGIGNRLLEAGKFRGDVVAPGTYVQELINSIAIREGGNYHTSALIGERYVC